MVHGPRSGRAIASILLLSAALASLVPASVAAATPDTTVTAGPSGVIGSTQATFRFTSTVSGSTFQCRLDGAAWARCTSPRTIKGLVKGSHTFTVRARKGSKVDASPASRTFKVDTSVPNTTITGGPSGWTFDSTPSFTFTSSKVGGSFQCKVDDVAFAACTSPFTAEGFTKGVAHTFKVRARNKAGTPDPTPASRAFTIDRKVEVDDEFALAAFHVYFADSMDLDVPPLCPPAVTEKYEVDCPAGVPSPATPQYRLTMTEFGAVESGTEPSHRAVQIRFLVSTLSAPIYGFPDGHCDLVVDTTADGEPDAGAQPVVTIDVGTGRVRALDGAPLSVYGIDVADAPLTELCEMVYGSGDPVGRTAEAGRAIRSAIIAHIESIGDLCAKLGPKLLGPCDP